MTNTIALSFSVWPEEGFLLGGGVAIAQAVLFPAHLPVLQEGSEKPSTFHPLSGNANHPLGERPPVGPTYSTRCL